MGLRLEAVKLARRLLDKTVPEEEVVEVQYIESNWDQKPSKPEPSDEHGDWISQLENQRREGHPDGCQCQRCVELRRKLRGELHRVKTRAQLRNG